MCSILANMGSNMIQGEDSIVHALNNLLKEEEEE
jgi:hypothetical protein